MKENKKRFFGTKITAVLLLVLLAVCVLAGCGGDDEDEKKSGKKRKSDDDKPTEQVSPTAEPTAEPTNEPTPVPTEEPTPMPTAAPNGVGKKESDYYGTWYCSFIQGLEGEPTNCADDPSEDYRLEIHEGYLTYIRTTDRIPYSEYGRNWDFELRTEWLDSDREFYKNMGYGMETYLDNPTDFEKGHLVYSCTGGYAEGALFIVDAQPDGTLQTLFAYVDDNGTFPVFTDGVYQREPVFEAGTYYEDYLGVWNCRSVASYYEDAFEINDNDQYDVRLLFLEGGDLEVIFSRDDNHAAESVTHYELRSGVAYEKMDTYRKWDEAGIRVWGEKQPGEAAAAAEKGTDLINGSMLFVCTDEEYEDEFLVVSYLKEFNCLGVDFYYYDEEGEQEIMEYFTFTRQSPYSYEFGTTYADFVDCWKVTEIQYEGDTEKRNVKNSGAYVDLDIMADGVVGQFYGESYAFYELRTEVKEEDPSWYADMGFEDVVTNYDLGRLVFTCTEGDYIGEILIVQYEDDDTITVTSYGKNALRTVYIPYRHYERTSGRLGF